MVWFQAERKQLFTIMDEKNIGNSERGSLSPEQTGVLKLWPYWNWVLLALKKGRASQGEIAQSCQPTDPSSDLTVPHAMFNRL